MIALALVVFALEQFLQTQSSFFVSNGRLVNYTVLIICGSAFGLAFAKGKLIMPPQSYYFAAVLLLYGFSTFFWLSGNHGNRGYDGWVKNAPYLLGITFFGSALIRSIDQARKALIATLVMATILCLGLLILAQWDSRGVVLASSNVQAVSSVLALASIGSYVAIIAGIINFPKKPYWLILRWLLVGTGLLLTLKTGSRGQTVAIVATILVFIPINRGQVSGRSIVAGALTLVALVVCIYLILPYTSTQRWDSQHIENAYQGRLWASSEMISTLFNENPIFWITGLGAGESYDVVGFYIHFTTVEVFCEEGLIGGILFLLILGIPTVKLLKVIVSKEKKFFSDANALKRNTLVVISALFFSEFLLSCKQGTLPFEQNLFLFAITLEFLCRDYDRSNKKARSLMQYRAQYQ